MKTKSKHIATLFLLTLPTAVFYKPKLALILAAIYDCMARGGFSFIIETEPLISIFDFFKKTYL